MSDTVFVALITLLAGIFGASIGAIVTLTVDSRGAKQRLREEKRICYAQLISLYNAFYAEIIAVPVYLTEPPSKKEEELFSQFQIACTNALLICGHNAFNPIAKFYEQLSALNSRYSVDCTRLTAAYVAAQVAMREDLGQKLPIMDRLQKSHLLRRKPPTASNSQSRSE